MSFLRAVRRPGNPTPPSFDARGVVEEDRKEQVGFIMRRFRVSPKQAEQSLCSMSLATRTILALEMRERERAAYISDYDPFREL